MKKAKFLITIILGIVILLVGILQNLLHLSIWEVFYWFILILLIILNLILCISSKYLLLAAFILFSCSALITTLDLRVLGESIMRISIIFWIIGIIEAIKEYRKLPS